MSDEILGFYAGYAEAERLDDDVFRLEAARTRELLTRFLPPPPADIVDVGGGAGAYAFELAEQGYRVRLLDLVPRHVEQARQRSAETDHPLAEISVGDARDLPWQSESADAALMLGPLYHLTEIADRARALGEVRRVLRPAGCVLAAGISRFASLLDGLRMGVLDDPRFREVLAQDLASGQHRNPTGDPRYFTTAYFHKPQELSREVAASGFRVKALLAIEGPGWLAPDFETRWKDSRRRAQLLDWVRSVEAEPAIFGVSAHLMVVAHRP